MNSTMLDWVIAWFIYLNSTNPQPASPINNFTIQKAIEKTHKTQLELKRIAQIAFFRQG